MKFKPSQIVTYYNFKWECTECGYVNKSGFNGEDLSIGDTRVECNKCHNEEFMFEEECDDLVSSLEVMEKLSGNFPAHKLELIGDYNKRILVVNDKEKIDFSDIQHTSGESSDYYKDWTVDAISDSISYLINKPELDKKHYIIKEDNYEE